MQPITFRCARELPLSAAEICAGIADVGRWGEFRGYGVLPGIASARYERRADGMVGSRIRVRNTDGSQHTEEILAWHPPGPVLIKLHEFTPPLSRLATQIVEEWAFEPAPAGTRLTRTFHMHPRRAAARPALWLISLLFRRAVTRHLAQMAAVGPPS